MPTSTRFAVASHILAALAMREGEPLRSDLLAQSASTNAAVVRRILGQLGAAGLTRSQLGTGGGALLARPPADITLLDVYRAVEEAQLFAVHRTEPDPACVVGCHILPALRARMDAAQGALEAELGASTIADVVADIRARARREARRRR